MKLKQILPCAIMAGIYIGTCAAIKTTKEIADELKREISILETANVNLLKQLHAAENIIEICKDKVPELDVMLP